MIRLQDIMTEGLIYFDDDFRDECMEFCRIRNISTLPHISDPSLCYHFDRKKERMEKRDLHPQQRVDGSLSIFHPQMLDLLQQYEVVFVQDGGETCGVVHFSDYNRPKVYTYLYQQLYQLERGLSYLVLHSRISLNTLRRFLDKEAVPEGDRPVQITDFDKLDTSIKDLLKFCRKHELLKTNSQDIHRITKIRNLIAHSNDLVARKSPTSLNFNVSSFKFLMQGVAAVQLVIRQVANRIYFIRALQEDAFDHNPRSIEDYLH